MYYILYTTPNKNMSMSMSMDDRAPLLSEGLDIIFSEVT